MEDIHTLNRPLLTADDTFNINPSPCSRRSYNSLKVKGSNPKFINYDEKEEATCIADLKFLQFQPLMCYVVVPLLSVASAFILAICMYWLTGLKKKMLYKEVETVEEATHVMVSGVEGNNEIIPLKKEKHVVFTYRFIKFEYLENSIFKAVTFEVNKYQSELLDLGKGISEA